MGVKTTPVQKIATVLGAGSLLIGGAALAPAASAAPPVLAAAAAPAAAPSAVVPDVATRTSLVAAWYEQFLRRSPDAGAKYWVVRLRTEAPAVVLADLLRTPEAVGIQVDDLYTVFLGRTTEGDPGADYWYGGIQRGDFPAEWAEQNILASPEYISLHSTPDGDAGPLVRAWYLAVLGRAANPGEQSYWAQQLSGSSPLGVLREIWYSPEAVDLRVASHYRDYLSRAANSGEIGYWAPFEVASDVGVVIAIATSAEYQANSPTFLP